LTDGDEPISELAICTRGLRKVFSGKVAVRNLTLDVPKGEVFGLLGPNGAGKSTLVKMLLGLVFPTSGEAQILGCPVGDVKTRSKVGFLPEHFRFYDWLTPTELLKLHGQLYGMSHVKLSECIPALLDLVGLAPHHGKRLRDFSKGMLQRIGLAQALMNEPELIFLDEPTSGLDPVGRRLFRDIIKAQRDRGATVLLNSHLLGEVEITCNRVAFMKDGEVLETRQLNGDFDEPTTVSIRAGNVTAGIASGLTQWSPAASMEGERLTLSVSSGAVVSEIVRYLVASGADIYEVTPQRLSLEQRFLEIVGTDGGL
jgi:ABC-2 type transport system ATP-binding protein